MHWLDRDLERLKGSPLHPPRDLSASIAGVIEADAEQRSARAAYLPTCAAAIVGALSLGVASGSVTASAMAANDGEMSVFSAHAQLAPSTLLDHHR